MKKRLQDYAFLFLVSGSIIVLDQWTKYLVRTHLAIEEMWVPWPWLAPYARIIHWKNTGAAFGIFQGFGDIFTVLAVIVSIAILFYFPQVPRRDWSLRLAMGLQMGGAVGNLIDRVTIGWVTDFISVGNFAVFNVADASISIGVAVLLLGLWRMDQEKTANQPPTELPPETAPDPPGFLPAAPEADPPAQAVDPLPGQNVPQEGRSE